MKKHMLAILIAALAVFTAFTGCKKTAEPTVPISPGGPGSSGGSGGSVLPEWEEASSENGWRRYENVTDNMLEDYLDSSRERGCTVLGEVGGSGMIYVIDKGECVEISASSEEGFAEMRVIRTSRKSSGGISEERAKELASLCLEKDEELAALIDLTPAELSAKAGLSYFEGLITRGGSNYRIGFFVGENGALTLRHSMLTDRLLVIDADGDGSCDVLTMTFGPSSGIHTEELFLIGAAEGVPYLKTSGIFSMEHGQAGLSVKDGVAALSLSERNTGSAAQTQGTAEAALYPIRTEGGELVIDAPADSDGPAAWGGAAFGYSYYDQRDELSEGITLIARREDGSMRFAPLLTAEAELPLFGYNALKFISAEETARLLERYGLPAEKLSVRMADFPMRADSALREATAEEYERIAELVGIG